MPTGTQLRDEAMRAIDAAVDPQWREDAYTAVVTLSHRRPYFTSDDVWATGLPKPHDPRALGPVMVRAAHAGYIASTSTFTKSTRPEAHAMDIRVWRSLSFTGPNRCPTCGRDA